MKRWLLLKLALLLLLGAIVNVAVAVLGAMTLDNARALPPTWGVPFSPKIVSLWQRHATDIWPEAPLDHVAVVGPFARRDHFHYYGTGTISYDPAAPVSELREIFRGIGQFKVEQTTAGFPAHSMRHEGWRGTPRSMFASNAGDDGLSIGKHTIPRTIIWPGFAINTVFYAAILWLLFAAPFALRRWRRIRRGLCPACAYPVGTSHVCTECGDRLDARD